MTTLTPNPPRPRAIGLYRVSRVNGRDQLRDGDAFHSPEVQIAKIEAECERRDLDLVGVEPELNTSGGNTLLKRPKLNASLIEVEAGQLDSIVFADRDRTDRSIETGSELIRRMDAAGGVLIAGGQVLTHKTPDQWANATLGSFLSEYQRRIIRQKTVEALERVVTNGVAPYPRIPPGYLRGDDSRLYKDPTLAPVMLEAFKRRAGWEKHHEHTIREVRDYLHANGVDRTLGAVRRILLNRVYLGELHFGGNKMQALVNDDAHKAIVPKDIFERAQRVEPARGRQTKSDRLLARLGVLRCESCGGRMVASSQVNVYKDKKTIYPLYRCSPMGDCTNRVTISAPIVEKAVIEEVKLLTAGIKETFSAQDRVIAAKDNLKHAQEKLDSAIRMLDELGSEPAAMEKLRELRTTRDDAQRAYDAMTRDLDATQAIVSTEDWDELTLHEQRDLIKAVIATVTVSKTGRGAERITIEPRRQGDS